MDIAASWTLFFEAAVCGLLAPRSGRRWQCLPLPGKRQGSGRQPGFFFLADPDFEALRNKNVQLLLVLTDDWISKLIM